MSIRPRISALAAAFLISAQSLLAPAAAQNLPNLGGSEREDLSPIMERKLGEQIMRDIRRDRDYLNDAPTLEYLNGFGNGLVAARPEVRGEAGYAPTVSVSTTTSGDRSTASAGRVGPSSSNTPSRSRASAASDGSPSTRAKSRSASALAARSTTPPRTRPVS